MLTEAQLEVAAREYCRLMGMDPDTLIYPVLDRRQWQCMEEDVKRYYAMGEALRLARAGERNSLDGAALRGVP